jgi:hypothetical protein
MAKIPDLTNKWAIVTGASSGIGLEFVRVLAAHHCNIVAVSNCFEQLTRLADELRNQWHVDSLILDVDLSSNDATEKVLKAIAEAKISPILLVNNAGIFDFHSVERLSEQRIDTYIDLHIRTLTQLSRAVAMQMADDGAGGYILNMSSMACWMPLPGLAMYSATKAFIRVFSRALRLEMKSRGVSVTVACPGGIATDLFGLPRNLQQLGVRLHVLATPHAFATKALRRTFGRKAQYVNGLLNRLAILFVATLPERVRELVKFKLLDRFESQSNLPG